MPPTVDMPKFTLDFGSRLFIAKTGVTEIDVQIDLYSDWKEALLANDELGQAPALRSEGGIPKSPTLSLGDSYFLINGYQIRPYEADHELTIVGDLVSDPFEIPIVVPTLGGFTVLVTHQVSSLITSVEPIATSILNIETSITESTEAVTSLTGDMAQIASNITLMQTDLETLGGVALGRWRMDKDANTLTFYNLAGAIIAVFDLKDSEGQPTTTNPFERIPVP